MKSRDKSLTFLWLQYRRDQRTTTHTVQVMIFTALPMFIKFRLHCISWHGRWSYIRCPNNRIFTMGWQSFAGTGQAEYQNGRPQNRRLVISPMWSQSMASGGSWKLYDSDTCSDSGEEWSRSVGDPLQNRVRQWWSTLSFLSRTRRQFTKGIFYRFSSTPS